MNKEFTLIVFKRFYKGLISVVGAFSVQFLLGEIPTIQAILPTVVQSPITLMVLSSAILALEKYLQGWHPVVDINQ